MDSDRPSYQAESLEDMLRLMCSGRGEGVNGRALIDHDDRHPADQRWAELNSALNPVWRPDQKRVNPPRRRCAETEHDMTRARNTVFEWVFPDGWRRRRHAVFMTVAAAFLLLVLVHVDDFHQEGLASLSAYEEDLASRYRDRGGTHAHEMSRAIETLLIGRRRIWFSPVSNRDTILSAVADVSDSYERSHDPFLRAEAAFLAGKGRLMLADVAEACRWFDRALEQRVDDYQRAALAIQAQVCP